MRRFHLSADGMLVGGIVVAVANAMLGGSDTALGAAILFALYGAARLAYSRLPKPSYSRRRLVAFGGLPTVGDDSRRTWRIGKAS